MSINIWKTTSFCALCQWLASWPWLNYPWFVDNFLTNNNDGLKKEQWSPLIAYNKALFVGEVNFLGEGA